MNHGKKFLTFSAGLYIVLGILFIINPAGMATGLGYENLSLNGLTDVMATYGGLEIGIGTVIYLQIREGNVETGLKILFWTFAGFAFGRTLAALRFQGFYGLHCYWLVFELVYLMITHRFLSKYKNVEEAAC